MLENSILLIGALPDNKKPSIDMSLLGFFILSHPWVFPRIVNFTNPFHH